MVSLLQWIVAKPNKKRKGNKIIQQDNTFTHINTSHSLHDEQHTSTTLFYQQHASTTLHDQQHTLTTNFNNI